MPHPADRSRHPRLTRADLPAELTPENLRHLDLRTLSRLSRPGNGILDAEDQRRFDAALAEVLRTTTTVVEQSLERSRRGGPQNLDPAMRRSYARMQQRLAEQVRRAGRSFPDLALDLPDYPTDGVPADSPAEDAPGDSPADAPVDSPVDSPTTELPADSVDSPAHVDISDSASGDDVSPAGLEREVEQTSDTLDMLERIASLQQEQVEHQHTQLLSETRGFFFAFLVSVAVIVAGVAPLVEAEPHTRILIIVWTLAVTAAAGLVYALVRAAQAKK